MSDPVSPDYLLINSCSTAFGAPPNTHTCPVCLGMPGVLPVLNKKVVEYTLRMAMATNCEIARESRFARKNYFYPDLPKGYQISQYELPIGHDGSILVDVNGSIRRIGITRIHMEEDAGKLSHDPDRPVSMVDFNRTGVPLIETVSEPDIRSAVEAWIYLRHLRSIVRYKEGSCLESVKISKTRFIYNMLLINGSAILQFFICRRTQAHRPFAV